MIQVEDFNDSLVSRSADVDEMIHELSNTKSCYRFSVENYTIVKYDENLKTSLFKEHLLLPDRIELKYKKIEEAQGQWSGFFLLLGLVLYAWLMYRNAHNFQNLTSSLFNIHNFSKKGKEKTWIAGGVLFPFILLIICFYGLLFSQICELPFWETPIFEKPRITEEMTLLKYCLLFSTCFLLLKFLLVRVLAFIFKTEEAGHFYLQLDFNYNTLAALVGLPFLLLSFGSSPNFQTSWIIIVAFICFLLFCIRFLRILSTKIEHTKFSYIHNFLYLCTLEFLIFLSSWKAFWMFFST